MNDSTIKNYKRNGRLIGLIIYIILYLTAGLIPYLVYFIHWPAYLLQPLFQTLFPSNGDWGNEIVPGLILIVLDMAVFGVLLYVVIGNTFGGIYGKIKNRKSVSDS